MGPMTRYCRDCGRDQVFDQPHGDQGSCPDVAGGECLEWACTGCGAALLSVIPGLVADVPPLWAGRVA
jgi:hypothetical protein